MKGDRETHICSSRGSSDKNSNGINPQAVSGRWEPGAGASDQGFFFCVCVFYEKLVRLSVLNKTTAIQVIVVCRTCVSGEWVTF